MQIGKSFMPGCYGVTPPFFQPANYSRAPCKNFIAAARAFQFAAKAVQKTTGAALRSLV